MEFGLFKAELFNERKKKTSSLATKLFGGEMVRAHNELAKGTNKRINILNKKFDSLHPGGDYESKTYTKFMRRGLEPVARRIKPKHFMIKRYELNDELALTAVTKRGKKFSLCFKQVK